jgi:hypothetical protein
MIESNCIRLSVAISVQVQGRHVSHLFAGWFTFGCKFPSGDSSLTISRNMVIFVKIAIRVDNKPFPDDERKWCVYLRKCNFRRDVVSTPDTTKFFISHFTDLIPIDKSLRFRDEDHWTWEVHFLSRNKINLSTHFFFVDSISFLFFYSFCSCWTAYSFMRLVFSLTISFHHNQGNQKVSSD